LYFLHLHDHLTASEEGVADELARAQGNLGVGHDGGCDDLATLALRNDLDMCVAIICVNVLDRTRTRCCRFAVVLVWRRRMSRRQGPAKSTVVVA
jgi:hypothetical protein